MAAFAIRRLSAQELSHAIITAAMRVHTELGPGLLESTYQACLQFELREAGVQSAAQVGLPVVYRGTKLELGYRIDLLVEDLVVVEIKSVEGVSPVSSSPNHLLSEAQRQVGGIADQFQCGSPEGRNQAFCERNWVERKARALTTKGTKVHERKQSARIPS
jgi:GxxExxY protein